MILSNDNESLLVLRNQANPSEVKDPITPIAAIMERVSKTQLMSIYKMGHFQDAQNFLYNVAVSKGKFKKVRLLDCREVSQIWRLQPESSSVTGTEAE